MCNQFPVVIQEFQKKSCYVPYNSYNSAPDTGNINLKFHKNAAEIKFWKLCILDISCHFQCGNKHFNFTLLA